MEQITTVGIDLAKNIFQVHAIDAAGRVVLQKSFRRPQLAAFFQKLPACLIGLEACSSAHHWGRLLTLFGHQVRLIPPAYVKPYVRRQKNDAADAAAICEAVSTATPPVDNRPIPDGLGGGVLWSALSDRTFAVSIPRPRSSVGGPIADRGIDICHETMRFWRIRFGPTFAAEIRRKRVKQMRLDEVYVKINGQMHYLWRAVDHEGATAR